MLAPDRLSCFWPGLAKAWWRGSASALLAALMFGWGLCVLMLATFVWPKLVSLVASDQLLDRDADLLGHRVCAQQLAIWQHASRCSPVAGDNRFAQAQSEYLKGNWFEAESLLHAILADAPRDAEGICS